MIGSGNEFPEIACLLLEFGEELTLMLALERVGNDTGGFESSASRAGSVWVQMGITFCLLLAALGAGLFGRFGRGVVVHDCTEGSEKE